MNTFLQCLRMSNRLSFLSRLGKHLVGLIEHTTKKPNENNMNDLQITTLKSPLQLKGGSRERKELADLLALHERATDPDLDPIGQTTMKNTAAIHAPVVPVSETRIEAGPDGTSESPAPAPSAPPDHNRLFFTGRLMTGKDYSANSVGAYVESFAKPLYFLLEHFFGIAEHDKDKGRAFMQIVGQWGRGAVSEKCPITPERAAFTAAIRGEAKRANFPSNLAVDWDVFGRDPYLWLNAAVARVAEHVKAHPGSRVALTNVRFVPEHNELKRLGWSGWHVMCSPQTWMMRLATKKLGQASPEVHDESEALASHIDRKVFTSIRSKQGPRLRVIWSDEKQPAPSARLHNLDSFSAEVNRANNPV